MVGVFGNGVECMSCCQADARQEIATPTRSIRLAPDKAAARDEPCLKDLPDLLVLSQKAPMPERGLKDVVQRCFDAVIWNIAFPDQAQDSGVERCKVSLPVCKRALTVLGPLVRHFGEGPRRSVVGNVLHELV